MIRRHSESRRRDTSFGPEIVLTAGFPLILESTAPQFNWVDWASVYSGEIRKLVHQHGALLLRSAAAQDSEAFVSLAESICPELYSEYGDLGDDSSSNRTYTSTAYPVELPIHIHNESACNNRWPLMLFFHCQKAAPEGGASRLVDGRKMLNKLPEDMRQLLEQDPFVYTRNHHPDLDTSWQRFYSSEDPREAERQCAENGVTFHWKPGQVLQTQITRPPVMTHPISGQLTLFHQLFLFHPQSLEAETRSSLATLFQEAEFPRAIRHKSGNPVTPETFQRLFDLYEENAVELVMRRGDILVIDNMIVAHGRAPFRGPRNMRIAMGMMVRGGNQEINLTVSGQHETASTGRLSRALTKSVYPSIVELIGKSARQSPEAVILSRGRNAWTYANLMSYAQIAAQAFHRAGTKPGDVVALAGEVSFETIGAMLAVWMCGGVLMPLDPSTPSLRLRRQLAATGCRMLVTSGEVSIQATGIPVLSLEGISDDPLAVFEPVGLSPDDPAYIFFTSGSTGTARGIRGLHGGLSHFLNWQREQFGISANDRFAQVTRPTFDVMLRDIFTPLVSGACLCLPPGGADLLNPWPWLQAESITAIHVVPSLMIRWLNAPGNSKKCPDLRWIFSAGEALDSSLVNALRRQISSDCKIINLYGPTETTLAKSWYCVPSDPVKGIQAIGTPLPETQILVLDENDMSCAPGVTGQIVIRTPHRTAGYLDSTANDKMGFRANPHGDDPDDLLFYSGDLGRFDVDGVLHIAGRLDDQLKIHGVRICPQEIASALTEHASIEQAHVMGEGNPARELIAFVVADERKTPRQEIIAFLAGRLPLSLIPYDYIYLSELPTTERGKVDRATLSAMASERKEAPQLQAITKTPLQSPTEKKLAELWASILGSPPVFGEDNFIRMGGHSLSAVQLLSRIRQKWNADMEVQDIFRNLELSDMARRIDEVADGRPATQLPLRPRLEPFNRPGTRLPLSSTQKRLWFLEQLDPGSGYYNIPGAVRFRGKLDVQILQQCVDGIVARQEPFRTRFIEEAGEPWQVVEPETALNLQILDLQQYDLESRKSRCLDAAIKAARKPFDLTAAPLLRLILIKLGDDDTILAYTFNHLIADGWTNVIFVREICRMYMSHLENADQGITQQKTESELQYADFALWEKALPADHFQKSLEYWKSKLNGVPDLLHLPTDRPRPALQSHASEECTITLSVEQTKKLQEFCSRYDVTLFIAMMTFLKVVLYRASGETDLCVGTPVANRHMQSLENAYGCFINTLAIRTRLIEGDTFRNYLKIVRDSVFGALAHQEVPFDKVVESVAPVRSSGHHPLFQVLLNVLHWEETPLSHPELRACREWLVPPQSKFDMTLYVRQREAGIDLHLVHNPDLFNKSRVQGWLEDMVELLEKCLAADGEFRIVSSGIAWPAHANEPAPAQRVSALHRQWTKTELELRSIWRELLNIRHFALTDNFFQLGGYSLLATRLVASIRDRLKVVIPVWKLFELPTVVELASFIDGIETSSSSEQLPENVTMPQGVALAPAQYKLWKLHAEKKDGYHYNVPRAVRMLGELHYANLQSAVSAVVQRHPALRTLYDDSGNTLTPRVVESGSVSLHIIDVDKDPTEELAVIRQEMTHQFDLRRELPLRVTLLRLSREEHVLIATTHHIAADCWSMGLPFQTVMDDEDPWHYGVFFRDLLKFYDAFSSHEDEQGQLPRFIDQEPGYDDIFANAQAANDLKDLPKALGFWKNYLYGANQSLRLPTDAEQPCDQFLNGRRTEFAVGKTSYSRLKNFSREHRTTDFIVLFACFARAIRQWAGSSDFLVGVPVSNRSTLGSEDLIGHIGNTIVLRARFREKESPAQLVKRLHVEIHEALAYQYYPFEDLVCEIGAEQKEGRSPLFQIRFVFQNIPQLSAHSSRLVLRPVQFDRGVSKYDLSLVIASQGSRLRGWCEYKTPLFQPSTVDNFIQQFLKQFDEMLVIESRTAEGGR